jgi:signal transduction histidine kinase/ActR/RegA family two-component response regulator
MSPVAPRRVKMRTRLVVLVALLLAVISAVILLVLPARARAASLRALRAETDAIARMTAYTVAPMLDFDDSRSADEAIAAARRARPVSYVVVENADRRRFAALHLAAALRAAYTERGIDAEQTVYRTSAAVERDGRRLGMVFVGVPLAPLRAEHGAIVRGTAALAALVFLAGLLASLVIGSVVTRPLRQMVEVAQEIGAGAVDVRAPADSDDEVGELARSFNHMLDRLLAARTELELLNHTLELRVVERTRALAAEVAERQRSEAALLSANERFTLAAAAVEGAIYDWDVAAGSMQWSDGIQRVFGHVVHEAPLDAAWRDGHVHPEDVATFTRRLQVCLQAGVAFACEYRFRSGDGEHRHVIDRAHVTHDAAGQAVRVVGIVEDVSAMRRLEEQYHHAQRMEAVGRLAGGVAHDFNNLLTAILGYSDLVAASLADAAPERLHVDEIQAAGRRAAELTNQLLTFSRRQVVQPRTLDLNEVVRGLGKMIGRLIGENIRLESRLSRAPLWVHADRGQLEQVIVNVLVNSRDAMPLGGRVTVTTDRLRGDDSLAWLEAGAEPGHYVLLEIRDTGTGMDEETRRRIFEPFFTTKAVGSGTGLGMATVYGIVTQSGGRIRVDSAPGEGTTVSIILPIAEVEATDAATAPPESAPRGSETLLVVEDEEAVRQLMAVILRSQGYHVLLARSGEEGIELARRVDGAIDLVVTDVVMPGIGGREMVEGLRRHRPGLRALFLSGYADDTILRHGVSSEQVPFLGKPFSAAALLSKIRDLLDARDRDATANGATAIAGC